MYVDQQNTGLSKQEMYNMDMKTAAYRAQSMDMNLKFGNRHAEHTCWPVAKVEKACTKKEEVQACSMVNQYVQDLLRDNSNDWTSISEATVWNWPCHVKHGAKYYGRNQEPPPQNVRTDRSHIMGTTSEDEESLRRSATK